MRRVSQQEWENEHMHNPMTEGEALAVDVGRKTLTDAALIAAWEAKAAVYEQGDDLGEQMMAWQLRDCANELRSRAAIAAHTAASGGEVAGWQRRYRTEGMEWSRWHGWEPDGREDPFPKTSGRWSNEFRPVYTAPPAAVPADALERLVAIRDAARAAGYMVDTSVPLDLLDELAALIPKGADHEQR